MACNENLVNKVREALMHQPKVEEKKMFQGLTFMVNEKMCVGIREDEMMCRIDPAVFESTLERNGCRPMIHGGRIMKGFVFVSQAGYRGKDDFNFWIGLAIDFNKKAKASKKKTK